MTPSFPPPPDPAATFAHGLAQFNRGEYYECHETWELLWRSDPGPLRDLYQGLIQIAAALYQWRRGRRAAVARKLAAGVARLQPYRPTVLGVDLERLLADLAAWQAAPDTRAYPRIQQAAIGIQDGAGPANGLAGS